MLYDNNAILK